MACLLNPSGKLTGGAIAVMKDCMVREFIRDQVIDKPLAIFLQWLCQAISKTSWGNRFLTKSGVTMPFGYFMVVQKHSSSKQ